MIKQKLKDKPATIINVAVETTATETTVIRMAICVLF